MSSKKASQENGLARRDFIKTGLTGAVALSLSGLNISKAEASKYIEKRFVSESSFEKPEDWKAWAKENFKGVENETLPSFSQDFLSLDEAGIRLDVNQAVKHGFHSTLCTSEAGLTFEEAEEFVSIVTDESQGRILPATTILFDTFDQCFKMLEHAAEAGCSHVLLGYPPSYYPHSENEIHDKTKEMIETANIGIVLYPSPKFNFDRFHDLGFPPDVLEDLVKLPNVFAVKVAGPLFEECHNRFGDKVLISSPLDSQLIQNVKKYDQQWIGAGPYELFQSPDKPYFVQMLNYLLEGIELEARRIYRLLKPVSRSFQLTTHLKNIQLGLYHWPMHKYFQWCSGGNGGYTRQPTMKLTTKDKETIRKNYEHLGISVSDSDEMFYVGRVNWQE